MNIIKKIMNSFCHIFEHIFEKINHPVLLTNRCCSGCEKLTNKKEVHLLFSTLTSKSKIKLYICSTICRFRHHLHAQSLKD